MYFQINTVPKRRAVSSLLHRKTTNGFRPEQTNTPTQQITPFLGMRYSAKQNIEKLPEITHSYIQHLQAIHRREQEGKLHYNISLPKTPNFFYLNKLLFICLFSTYTSTEKNRQCFSLKFGYYSIFAAYLWIHINLFFLFREQ